ncbi:glycosyltransferase family 2 protein [Roseivirga pacifica]
MIKKDSFEKHKSKARVKKLSIITVCLNSEATIADTLKSVVNQDYSDYEHIVFDGGSTDGTIDILKSYKDKVRLIEGSDSGIFDAMNQAISFASGDVIGILNSDDFYSNNGVLSKVMEVFKNSHTASVYGDLCYVNRKDVTQISRYWKARSLNVNSFKYGWSIPHPTFFVKRELYDLYGKFDSSFKVSGDYELTLRFLLKHRIAVEYIPEILVYMRTGGNSDQGIAQRIRSYREDRIAWKKAGLKPRFYTVIFKVLRKLPQLTKQKR